MEDRRSNNYKIKHFFFRGVGGGSSFISAKGKLPSFIKHFFHDRKTQKRIGNRILNKLSKMEFLRLFFAKKNSYLQMTSTLSDNPRTTQNILQLCFINFAEWSSKTDLQF